MNKKYTSGLDDLFSIFEENISANDILASKVLSEISSALAKKRIELGMTQKQFAKYMDVSQGMVSKWESTDYNFSIRNLADIAVKLDMNLSVNFCKPVTKRERMVYEYTQQAMQASVFINNAWTSLGNNGRNESISQKENIKVIQTIMEGKRNGSVRKWDVLCNK